MKRIVSIFFIILLLALYVSSFVLAIIGNPNNQKLLMLAIGSTIVIPVFMYIYLKMGKTFIKKDISDNQFIKFDNKSNINLPNEKVDITDEELEKEAMDYK